MSEFWHNAGIGVATTALLAGSTGCVVELGPEEQDALGIPGDLPGDPADHVLVLDAPEGYLEPTTIPDEVVDSSRNFTLDEFDTKRITDAVVKIVITSPEQSYDELSCSGVNTLAGIATAAHCFMNIKLADDGELYDYFANPESPLESNVQVAILDELEGDTIDIIGTASSIIDYGKIFPDVALIEPSIDVNIGEVPVAPAERIEIGETVYFANYQSDDGEDQNEITTFRGIFLGIAQNPALEGRDVYDPQMVVATRIEDDLSQYLQPGGSGGGVFDRDGYYVGTSVSVDVIDGTNLARPYSAQEILGEWGVLMPEDGSGSYILAGVAPSNHLQQLREAS